jgi:hypothetical protein
MPSRSRLYTVLATAGLGALAACSSSSGPKAPTPQALATHFDSIYSALLSQGTDLDSMIGELVAITAVTPPAYGSQQGSFSVTTGSGAATWKGYTIELASTGNDGDSEFVSVAFSDNNLSQLVFATADYDNGGFEGGEAVALINLATLGTSISYTGSAGVASVGNTCPTLQSGLASEPVIAQFTQGATGCEQAKFNIAIAATFPDSLGALSSVSISNATFDGIRFSAPESGPSHVAPIPSRIAALGLRLRNFRSAHTVR